MNQDDLRDRFAMAAMQGLLASESGDDFVFWNNGKIDDLKLAYMAYDIAVAMLEARSELVAEDEHNEKES